MLKYNSVDLVPYFKDKVGKTSEGKNKELSELTFIPKNQYMIAYSNEDIFALKL